MSASRAAARGGGGRARGIAFDWDGTLCDTDFLLDKVLEAVLTRHCCWQALDLVAPYLYRARGGVPLAKRIMLPERNRAAIVQDIANEARERSDNVGLFPGISSMLGSLAARNVPVAIVTGRDRNSLVLQLQKLGLQTTFGAIVCAEDSPRKPDPTGLLAVQQQLGVREMLYVGNSDDDAAAAAAGGFSFVGVKFFPKSAVLREDRVTVVSPEQLLSRMVAYLEAPEGIEPTCRKLECSSES